MKKSIVFNKKIFKKIKLLRLTKTNIISILGILLLSFTYEKLKAQNQTDYNIIPYPAKLHPKPGNFIIDTETTIIAAADRFSNEVRLLQNYLGVKNLNTKKNGTGNSIVLKYDTTLTTESYTINIDKTKITLAAGDNAGMFYATETLRQLLVTTNKTAKENNLIIPCVQIADNPAFPWRGMMLDVSRHFFSISYLKKFADIMARYKLNKLHLHLTDDQGWRIEIKKYPRLALEGAWRTFNNQDSACIEKAVATGNTDFELEKQHIRENNKKILYGGFYTQEEMRDFISYAASRHIEIIPEIDMPGHMMAATKIYPELTCDTLIGSTVGVFSNPICPCKQEVLEFAQNVFTEITELFPSRYIHLGGDEVNKKNWQESSVVQNFMKQKGFIKVEQVQSYFNNYMQDFFASKGKVLLGWDEIIEGGVDSSAAIMYWRGWVPEMPSLAAKRHHKIIMSPSGPLYFDAIPDALTLPAVYHYNPFDKVLYNFKKTDKQLILGVQANVWTEMIPSEKRLDYMIMPRMTALSEIGWTYRYNYTSYLKRLDTQYRQWDEQNINYRLPDLTGLVENYAIIGKTVFFTSAPDPYFKIHYTIDSTSPNMTSPIMDSPLSLNKATMMKIALFSPGGRRGDTYTLHFNEQQYAIPETVTKLKDGLNATLHIGYFTLTTNIKKQVDSVFIAKEITVPPPIKVPAFGLKFKGYIQVPNTGVYTFYLTCNDGAVLYIGNQQIINNDGLHPDRSKGAQIGLEKGLHAIALDFMDYGGGYVLDLKYSFNGSTPKPIPASWLKSGE
ncbi:beta-hexosaminidase [Terrimonas sp.]|uniref:family 20 glycosylhydrolase n=1 Tax=Terrimonas sp. TaxID=1914338 RepID=UPI000D512650|nr:family 20 glycosylhydrolase [Terrimonas sp.]PVD52237.1 beta-hexosaminidase [Terrimonas sp.]